MPTVSFVGLERESVLPAFCGAGVLQRSLHTLPHVYLVPSDQTVLPVDVARWQDPADAAIARLGRDARSALALRSLLGGYAAALYGQAMAAAGGCQRAQEWCSEWLYAWPSLWARITDGPYATDMRPAGMVLADGIRELQAEWQETARQTERRVAAERLAAVYPDAEPTEVGDAKLSFDHPEFGKLTVYAVAPKFGPADRHEAVRPVRAALRVTLLAHYIAKASGIERYYGSPHVIRDTLLNPNVPGEARAFLKAVHAGEHPDVPATCQEHMDVADRQSYLMADRACRFAY